MSAKHADLLADLLDGKHRALARVITKIENRDPGYRDLVSELHDHTGHADVIGITGSPGAGKSTLVDKVANYYRDRGETVGVIAIDPSSPFTGGAVLGDRIRMASNVGDMDVFFRSMSARGSLGGLSTATTDAVKALDAFGKDKIIVETVGAGQNEIDIVKTADTVAVLVPPESGDNVQMLKAGILEIADVFVVNKADLPGADRAVSDLKEMVHMRGHEPTPEFGDDVEGYDWTPDVIETIAKEGDGVIEFVDLLDEHHELLEATGMLEAKARTRYAEEIRALLREDANRLVAEEIESHGGMADLVEAVFERTTDPYSVVDEVMSPIEDCLHD
ncbi:methylmalonyl Co-A mutase-associated GTPase MeaB [Haladaptatus caseinilyticus]|uniref:methylmalonyl Co-A mutase-associated GTPase MeaB n=1 Tax=Haladaptatus caseinilyticus TaxID=2993314 RepID=UPI00224AFBDA|nr:methylmalonyl Co-A mutase-associated GTPase MeaB [Haladaptatus caseinilyticus]